MDELSGRNTAKSRHSQYCLRDARSLLLSAREKPSHAVAGLKTSQGIGIGFVDGDMDVVWHRKYN